MFAKIQTYMKAHAAALSAVVALAVADLGDGTLSRDDVLGLVVAGLAVFGIVATVKNAPKSK